MSCAEFLAGQPPDELTREGDLLVMIGTRGKEYIDPKTCYVVYGPGDTRVKAKRFENDGSVCAPGCSAVPKACPTPQPSPSVPVPSPLPSNAPPLTESGNLPLGYLRSLCATGFSPTHEVGISVLSRRECAGEPNCEVVNLNATEKSVKPYCEHSCYDESGRYSLANCRSTCETLRECQQPEFVSGNSGVVMEIWGSVERGACDKRTADCDLPDCRRNFICHDRVVNRGKTFCQACMPDGSKCGPVKDY